MKKVIRCEISKNHQDPFFVLERFSDSGLTRRFVKECDLLMQEELNSSWSPDQIEHWCCQFFVDDSPVFKLMYNCDWFLPFSGEFLFARPSRYFDGVWLCYPHRIHTYVDIANM